MGWGGQSKEPRKQNSVGSGKNESGALGKRSRPWTDIPKVGTIQNLLNRAGNWFHLATIAGIAAEGWPQPRQKYLQKRESRGNRESIGRTEADTR